MAAYYRFFTVVAFIAGITMLLTLGNLLLSYLAFHTSLKALAKPINAEAALIEVLVAPAARDAFLSIGHCPFLVYLLGYIPLA
jgi:hypothetical protein